MDFVSYQIESSFISISRDSIIENIGIFSSLGGDHFSKISISINKDCLEFFENLLKEEKKRIDYLLIEYSRNLEILSSIVLPE